MGAEVDYLRRLARLPPRRRLLLLARDMVLELAEREGWSSTEVHEYLYPETHAA